jgi:hypothetical protein
VLAHDEIIEAIERGYVCHLLYCTGQDRLLPLLRTLE